MDQKRIDVYLRSAFRKAWRYSDTRKAVLDDAKVGKKFRCKLCKKLFTKEFVKVDHIDPVVDPKTGEKQCNGHVDWNNKYERLFVTKDKLQVLSDDCHDSKTKIENKERRERRKNERKNKN